HTAIEQLPFIDLGDRWPLIDPGVKIRLGEARFIYFLVAVFAVAIHVDDKVASEFLAKIERHFSDKLERERVFTIHVKNGDLDHLGDIGGVHRRTRVFRQSGKTDLVVDNNVEGAAGRVTSQL